MSTKPGATTHPSASTTRAAFAPPARPTATMRPAAIATSAVYGGSPLPSTTVPARINRARSGTACSLPVTVLDAVHACGVGAEDLALPLGRQSFHMLHQFVDDTGVLRVGVREVAGPDQIVLARELRHRAHRALAGIEAD